MIDREQLLQAISAQEMLRGTVPDDIIDSTIAVLQRQLDQMASPASAGQQRKQVTVLFADVAGSTGLTQALDPEDNLTIMDNALRRLSRPVEKRGGHILRYMGDGFLAVFGYTMNRENEPDQAVMAGLAILEEAATYAGEVESSWGIEGFNVRVGISTGMVVIGGESDIELPLAGAAVNLAARMENAAEPGTVLISHDTYRHVRGAFDVTPGTSLVVKGFSAPVPVYTVTAAKERSFRVPRLGVEGVETRMVGRAQQLALLQERFTTIADENIRCMVTVVGEAGVGKSRLLFEFENWVDLQPDPVTLYRGRARLETQNVPYALLRDLIAFRFSIQDDDQRPLAKKKLETGLQEVLGIGRQTTLQAHLISRLLGYGFSERSSPEINVTDPKELHDRALIYLANYFKQMAREGPVLIILEDLHWADDSSLDFLTLLVLALRDRPVMLLAAARPAHYARRPDWMNGYAFHQRIDLTTLSTMDSRALVDDVLQKVPEVPEALRELVVSNADGNPFYLEELIKTLIERGVIVTGVEQWQVSTEQLEATQVPPTLTGVLQARLLALPEKERELLQQASVVGRVFWDTALRYLNRNYKPGGSNDGVTSGLNSLMVKELIHKRELSSFIEAEELIFKHAILRDVTYETVLRRTRRQYHGLVADWLIEQGDVLSSIFKGVIAGHLEMAGRRDEAQEYLVAAAASAAAAFANEEAIEHYTRALALSPEDDLHSRFQLLLSRVRLFGLRGNRSEQKADLETMEQMALTMADLETETLIAVERAHYAYDVGDFQAAIEAGQRSVEMAGQASLPEQEILGSRLLALGLRQKGKYGQALQALERALTLAQEIGDERGQGLIYNTLGPLASAQGDYPQARVHYGQAMALARRSGDRYLEGAALNNLGNTSLRIMGDYTRAREEYEGALGIAREIGDRQGESIALMNLGVISADLGVFARAEANYRASLAVARDIGDRLVQRIALGNLGSVDLLAGEYERSQSYYQQGLALAQDLGDRNGEATMMDGLSEALIGLGEPAEAVAMAKEAVRSREALGEKQLVIESRATLASAELAAGNRAAALVEVMEVLAFLDAGGTLDGTSDPLRILQLCLQVLEATGEGELPKLLEMAHTQLQARAANILDDDLRQSFLENIPWNQKIVQLWRAHQSGG